MQYMNKETGEILTRKEMMVQFREMYDGDDITNIIGASEYFEVVAEEHETPDDLAGILSKFFGSKKPFRKRKVIIGVEDGVKKYSSVTKSGWKAYGKLTDCIYALGNIGVISEHEVHEIIEDLDDIMTEGE